LIRETVIATADMRNAVPARHAITAAVYPSTFDRSPKTLAGTIFVKTTARAATANAARLLRHKILGVGDWRGPFAAAVSGGASANCVFSTVAWTGAAADCAFA
jgi:hypothetical protein